VPLIRHSVKHICAFLILCFIGTAAAGGQSTAQANPASAPPDAAVSLNGKTLFTVQGVLSFSAASRAEAITRRIESLSRDRTFQPQSLAVQDSENTSDITAGDLIVMSVTDRDAHAAGITRQALAREYAQRIGSALLSYRRVYSVKSLILDAVYALIATAILIILLRLLSGGFRDLHRRLAVWRGTRIPSLRIQKFELLSASRIAGIAAALARLVHFAVVITALYIYASVVLGFFPWTRGYAQILVSYTLSPLRLVWEAIVASLPNLFFITIILIIAFYVTKLVRVLFSEIEKGTITFGNFYPEWAQPTYKIARVLILATTVVVIFPYIPGSKSPAFRGISIFLGVLVSLGSSSAVANVVAGVILTYMRAFKIGDRVKIVDTVGDVTEKTLLVTRIRSIKNEDITITNAMVLNSHIVNFSTSARQEGLILHTSVTIGYDAPWRTVHQLLIDAALACEGVLKEPRPFVLQTALDDFYVHYEINAFTNQPSRMAQIYSVLHENIQDKFDEAGVEIMSSHYANVRDGNRSTIPAGYLPKDYTSPHFQLGLDALGERFKVP
jgi:small-conductance mechanosensitive channel